LLAGSPPLEQGRAQLVFERVETAQHGCLIDVQFLRGAHGRTGPRHGQNKSEIIPFHGRDTACLQPRTARLRIAKQARSAPCPPPQGAAFLPKRLKTLNPTSESEMT